jgi:hypothetical protein
VLLISPRPNFFFHGENLKPVGGWGGGGVGGVGGQCAVCDGFLNITVVVFIGQDDLQFHAGKVQCN